jgi:hypothetical protein
VQPKLTPEDVQLLRQLNERDRQVLGGMPRPRAADGLRVLGYVAVHSPNSQDLLFTITRAGRAALARIESGDVGLSKRPRTGHRHRARLPSQAQ